VILIDATAAEARRHSHPAATDAAALALVHLLGLRHTILAVNKMDRVAEPRRRFDAIVSAYRRLAAR
jgi:sulfate adenylyltransferase subunit 1 (EFTu-like GTPase family)